MNTFLYCDTETSNLTTKNIVQLAAILATETKELCSINLLIKPNGWTIDPKAEAVHGISMEKATKYGVGIEEALWVFNSLAEQADYMVCHNHFFDDGVIGGEYKRLRREWRKPGICTMLLSKDHCKIPPTERMRNVGMRGYKNPSLMEVHQHFLGCGFENGHDGFSDAMACLRIHRKILSL